MRAQRKTRARVMSTTKRKPRVKSMALREKKVSRRPVLTKAQALQAKMDLLPSVKARALSNQEQEWQPDPKSQHLYETEKESKLQNILSLLFTLFLVIPIKHKKLIVENLNLN